MTGMLPVSPLDTTVPVPVPVPNCNQELGQELTLLAGHINAAQHRFLKLLAALIDRRAWDGGSGVKSPAHWLNYYCGIDLGAAREKVRVAKALGGLPLIDQAFATGAISYSKVRAMTRSATPENEAFLVDIARHGTAQHMEKLVRQHQRVERLIHNDQARQQHQERSFSAHYDEDGMLVIKGRFAPEEGAVVMKAMEAACDALQAENNERDEEQDEEQENERDEQKNKKRKQQNVGQEAFPRKRLHDRPHAESNVSAETSVEHESAEAPSFPQKRADAVLRMAEHFLATHEQGIRGLTNGDKYQVLLHLQADSNANALPDGAYLDDGPPLAPATARRIACDAALVPLVEDGSGSVLNIGRKSRTVPPAMRRALTARDGGCRFPGCCTSRHVDAHHIHHWCDGGETSLDNLVLLCRYHHRLLHEGGYFIEKTEGKALRFMNTGGRQIPSALYPQFEAMEPRSDGKIELELQHESMGLTIDSRTAVTRWCGERMDYRMAVEALLRRRASLQ